ncbi:hypothetical protein JCM9140_2344 [Halalkalibacter wakoensis JCM 9140]|uniref:Uncharacterized protein n=1 Tax=Halalkalibacter wakoensis JCM 9140 TaxID=1236970 RepID=W4Q2W5_9BACI|nr:hypothetical protein [Halalkalibacter wakoensis]GAE26295.1 hypothetical protein JCM9140_2344 [Halalkalibacter wakoensis JCM 9140]
MYQNLPTGLKISITRSIKTAFLSYMSQIEWDESVYSSDQFVQYWFNHSGKHAAWAQDIDQDLFNDARFQEDLLKKINEVIQNIFETEPTPTQISEIESLVAQVGSNDVDYSCKAEAAYYIEKLQKQVR